MFAHSNIHCLLCQVLASSRVLLNFVEFYEYIRLGWGWHSYKVNITAECSLRVGISRHGVSSNYEAAVVVA